LAVHDLLHLIGEVKQAGASVLMSTHVLDTAEKFCDRFVLLHAGEIQTQGSFEEIKANYPDAGDSLNDIYLSLTGVTRNE